MVEQREVMWRRIMDDRSFEHATVATRADGTVLSGTVLVAEGGAPLRMDYTVRCDAEWRTRHVELVQIVGGERRALCLEHDGRGTWRRDGMVVPDLAGCSDVDLGLSPSTNMLPVNRLGLAVGARAIIRAAWIRFPSLDIVPAEQAYERIEPARYRYSGLASGFETVIDVDDVGLPIEYGGVWSRVGARVGPLASRPSGLVDALACARPHSELADRADDFGWLRGGWVGEVIDHLPDGTVRHGTGEWCFDWVLEGRAMQDVWIVPTREDRSIGMERAGNRYGTTLRWYDRPAGLWRVVWVNPVSGVCTRLSGRREGDRIALVGEQDGVPVRWSFNEIRPDSFRWLGEAMTEPDRWRVEAEFRLTRRT